jgi:cytochrome c oxidase subunit II
MRRSDRENVRAEQTPGSHQHRRGEIVLKSADVPHGIRFREVNVEVKAPKSRSEEVESIRDRISDFVDHCSVFCGAGHG